MSDVIEMDTARSYELYGLLAVGIKAAARGDIETSLQKTDEAKARLAALQNQERHGGVDDE